MRFLYQVFLELLICALINITYHNQIDQQNRSLFQYSLAWGILFMAMVTVLYFVMLLLVPWGWVP